MITLYRILFVILIFPAMGIILSMTLGHFMEIRQNIFGRLALLFVCGVLVSIPIYLADWANILPSFAVFMAVVWMMGKGSSLKRLTLGFMFASTIFANSVILDNWGRNFLPEAASRHSILSLLFCLLLYLVTKKLAPEKNFELAPAMWKLMLLLTITPTGIVLSLVLLTPYETGHSSLQYLVLTLLALFSFVGLLWTVLVLARQQKLEQEAMMAQMNKKYYEIVEQQHGEIRRLRHDMANHLQTLSRLDPKQRDSYIRELLDHPGIAKTVKYCADDTVNAILSIKASLIEQLGGSLHVRADVPRPLPIEKTDICAILGNALDNAMEAIRKLPPTERRISLELCLAKGMLVMRVENTCSTVPLSDHKNGLFATTKKDKSVHGFGLHSIRESVQRYDGQMEARTENGKFILFVYCRAE